MTILKRISAFFMSIILFFTTLFSGGTKSTVDPTLHTDPAAASVSEEEYGLPSFDAGEKVGIFLSSGSTEILRYEKTSADDLHTYCDLLCDTGFEIYDEHEIENNQFATLVSDTLTVNLSWFSKTGTTRIVAEERAALCPLTDECEHVCDSLLTGMKGETVVAEEGMGYIIRLADGSFCIIDGGMGDPDGVDADKLMNILLAQKPAGTQKPVIAAWLFSHLHGDHIGVFNCFSLAHHDDVVIEQLVFNFPKEEEVQKSDSPYMLDDTIYRYTQFKKNLAEFYPDVPVLKVHTGDRFAVRNARFDVLFTLDDLYPKSIMNGGMNDSSLLLKMTIDGQSTLWTGDFGANSVKTVLSEFSTETLSSDILQLAHHGMNGTVDFYSAVDPSFALLPVWEGGYEYMRTLQQNKWLINSPNLRQLIVTGQGTWTIRLPYAPAAGTFERIPPDDYVNPSYPQLLGE